MPFANEHAARIKKPSLYKRLRRENDKGGDGIDFIWGVRKDNDKVEVQAIRFDKNKFTPKEAKEWLKEHDFKAILFENATGGSTKDKNKEGDKSSHLKKKKKKKKKKKPGQLYSSSEKKKTSEYDEAKTFECDESGIEIEQTASGKSEGGANVLTLTKPKADKNIYKVMHNTDHRIKTGTATVEGKSEHDPGWVEGYSAVWDNVDLVREVFRKGAFAKSIPEMVPGGKVKLMLRHFRDGGDVKDMVGTIERMEEDNFGLFFHSNFDEDDLSQMTRQKVVAGKIDSASVGYRMVTWGFTEIDGVEALEHTEAKVLEVTLTLRPANPLAALTGAKSVGQAVSEMRSFAKLLNTDPESLTPEESGRLLQDHFGSVEQAREFGKGSVAITEHLDGLLKAAEPQNTEEGTGGTDESTAASISSSADLHRQTLKEIELRRIAVRR